MSKSNAPFITLGRHLKYLREQSSQSLAETSGAVEIEERTLQQIEAGIERPSEDILLLLISHFDIDDHEAVKLWELAEYEGEAPEQIRPDFESASGRKATVMLLAIDMRTQYSDGVEIICNQAGVTMHFSQATGQSKTSPVARVGMSYEQAEQVLEVLQKTLRQAEYMRKPKALPHTASRRHQNQTQKRDSNIEDTAL